MRRITVVLTVATLMLVACGDEANDASATTAPASTFATTPAPASRTSATATTVRPTTTTATTTTTTQPPTTTTNAGVIGGDTADPTSALPDVVTRYTDALIAGDAEAFAALFTDDAVLSMVSEDHTRSRYSPPLLRGAIGDWFQLVDYIEVEYINVIVEGTFAVVVSNWSGTSGGSANPTPFVAPTITVFDFDDGLISGCDSYFVYDQVVNSTPPSTTSVLPDVVNLYVDAVLAGDGAALAELFTDEGVLTGVLENHSRSLLRTPGVIHSMMRLWFCYVDYTDIEQTMILAEGNSVVVVSELVGTSGTHARGCGDKTPFSAVTVTVFVLDDGLLASVDDYFEYDQIAN